MLTKAHVTLITVCHKNPHEVARLITAVRSPSRRSVETIVFDDGSDEETRAALASLEASWISCRRRWGKTRAMNAAATVSATPYLLFVDAGLRPLRGWHSAVERLAEPNTTVIGAIVSPGLRAATTPRRFSPPLLVPRCRFLDLGGFDENRVDLAGRARDGADCVMDLAARCLAAGMEVIALSSGMAFAPVRDFRPSTCAEGNRGFRP